MHYENGVDSPGVKTPIERRKYDCLDWTMDLVLELTEEHPKRIGADWRTLTEVLDALEWPRGPVEEIIAGALEAGDIYEPVLGTVRLMDHGDMADPVRDHTLKGRILIHSKDERIRFMEWVRVKRSSWDKRKAEPSLIDMRILRIPRHIGEEILGILAENGITTVTTRPAGGIS